MNPILIRVDDYPTGSKDGIVWPAAERLYEAFHSLMQGVPYLLAVVPAYAQLEHLDVLCEDGVEVGVHGWNHSVVSSASQNCEFTGINTDGCRYRLRNAFEKLERFGPKVFVAPFNTYTDNTIQALEHLHCHYATTGQETGEHNWGNVKPIPSDFYGTSSQIFRQLHSLFSDTVQIITLHWTWEICEIVNGRSRMPELIDAIKDRAQPWSEVLECL